MTWKLALKTFCDLYSDAEFDLNWIIVGSVGSVLQHAEMTPNDLDIYVRNPEDVALVASLFKRYNMKSKSELSYFDPEWYSSTEEPFFTQTFSSGFTWTKGKWKIDDFQIEVVQISNSAGIPDSVSGEGIWEGGNYIWELKKYISFNNYLVPVVPLEIQLESNIRRNRQDRVDAIINALKSNGYDENLFGKALSKTSKEKIIELL